MFGKWERGAGDFLGRSLTQLSDRINVCQQKYILENTHPIKVARGRLSQGDVMLSPAEKAAVTTLVYQINWVGRETRPDVAGTASLLASRVTNQTVSDLAVLNRAALMLRNTASQPLVIWRHSPDMIFAGASDCAGAGTARDNGAQGAWQVMARDKELMTGQNARVSPLSWRSTRVKRVVASTLAGETLALSASLAEMEWLQVLYRDIMFHDVNSLSWGDTLGPVVSILRDSSALTARQSSTSVVDAKSVFDVLTRNTAGSKEDKRTAIELAIIKESLRHSKSQIRWLPHWGVPADQLTKAEVTKANAALERLLQTGRFRLLRSGRAGDVCSHSADSQARPLEASFRDRAVVLLTGRFSQSMLSPFSVKPTESR